MVNMNTLATPRTAVPQIATSTWNLDPVHSVAEFKVKHMMISNVKGQFANVTGVLTLDESDPTNSGIEASIEAASIPELVGSLSDRKSTRLNSSHQINSYAVFCLNNKHELRHVQRSRERRGR